MKRGISLSFLAALSVFLLFFTFGCAGLKTVERIDNGAGAVFDSEIKKPTSQAKKPVDIRQEFGVPADYKLTLEQSERLMWVKKSRGFAIEKLGFKPTWNFTKFKAGIKHTSIFYHRKDAPFPFSQIDTERIVVLDKKYGRDEVGEKTWLAAKRGVTEKDYDIWMYHPDGIAGSEYVTPTFLQLKFFRMTGVVLHEMWHINVRLPLHFEEASCVLIEHAGASMLWYENKDKTRERIEEWLKFAEAINLCRARISELSARLQDGKISLKEYLREREKFIKVANESQTRWPSLTPTTVVHFHTYTYYFPLVCRLYRALDCDVIKFIRILKEMNERDDLQAPFDRNSEIQFLKTREVEKKIEVYLENAIQKAFADKKNGQ